MALDYTRYIESRDKGLVHKANFGNVWGIVIRKWDTATGAEIDSEIVTLKPENVKAELDRLAEQVRNLQALYDDITIKP